MKCSKCGFNNPEEAIFCEKCDWKLGETYIPEMKVNRTMLSAVALVIGIVAIIPIVIKDMYIVSTVVGALGLVIGGYSFNAPRLLKMDNRQIPMALSAIGLILSAVAFIYSIAFLV